VAALCGGWAAAADPVAFAVPVPLLLILIFIVVPVIEIYVIIQIGQAIGALWTVVLLIADAVIGSMILRHQGRAAWRRFNEALRQGRVPAREVLDGVLIIFGGAFMLTPGFVTDFFGLLFLLPPTRAVIRRLLVRRVTVAAVGPVGGWRPPRTRRGPGDPYDVEGSASEIDDPPRRLP
jgi:UPF0716 protein FxsA